MLSMLDQENLAASHHTTAAGKPLNQNIRALQSKRPGPQKTPFRPRHDENVPLNTAKATKNIFATPAPQTTNRAPLGAKTTNAKAFQTPAPGTKPAKVEQTARKQSTTRRSIKKKVYVEPEPVTLLAEAEAEEDYEPDFGYAPPPIVPLPDPPLDFSGIDQDYTALRPENFNCGVEEIYFQSPKDENGFSISLKKQEEAERKSLEDDLDRILLRGAPKSSKETKIEVTAESKPSRPKSRAQLHPVQVNTMKARSAASALSQTSQPRTHQRLPSAALKETASSRSKRKPAFAVASDDQTVQSTAVPISKATIGFPKAKKPASILPRSQQNNSTPQTTKPSTEQLLPVAEANLSPRKFVELYGRPSVEEAMWLRLRELEIKDRRRGAQDMHDSEEQDFIFDDDLNHNLSMQLDGEEDFELKLEDFE